MGDLRVLGIGKYWGWFFARIVTILMTELESIVLLNFPSSLGLTLIVLVVLLTHLGIYEVLQ